MMDYSQMFIPTNRFFVTMQYISFAVLLFALFVLQSGWEWWALSFVGYFLITGLGISVTFHRLLTHKSYTLAKPLEYLFAFLGNLGCTGSSIGWVFIHRMHHKHSDKPGDPHSPVIGGPLAAFKGDYSAEFNRWIVRDVVADRVHRFMHKYYIPTVLAVPVLLYLVHPLLSIYGFFIPVFLNAFMSRMSNWVDHDPRFGTRPAAYKRDAAHNVWWWALVTWGEGWHYNHHSDPGNFRIGKSWYQIDIGRYVIETLMMLGLARGRIR